MPVNVTRSSWIRLFARAGHEQRQMPSLQLAFRSGTQSCDLEFGMRCSSGFLTQLTSQSKALSSSSSLCSTRVETQRNGSAVCANSPPQPTVPTLTFHWRRRA